jgi:hypothetical protein
MSEHQDRTTALVTAAVVVAALVVVGVVYGLMTLLFGM